MSNEKKIAVLEFSGVLMPDYYTDYITGMVGYHTALSIKGKINALLENNDSVLFILTILVNCFSNLQCNCSFLFN